MRNLKPSGVKWIGDVPEGWELVQTKRMFCVVAGATPQSDIAAYWDGDIPWITPADYKTKDHYITFGRRSISKQGYDSCGTTIVPENSIIFSKRAPIGSIAISKQPLCTNQGCLSCIPKSRELTNCNFFYHVMSIASSQYELLGSGTTFKEISLTSFNNFILPTPPINEQISIASHLDDKCAQLDALVANEQAQIEKLKQYRKSVITEAVTKGLDPTVPMKDSGVEWIGKVPEHWSIIKAKHSAQISHGSDPKTEGDVPVYGSGAESFKRCGEYKEGPCVLIGRKGATLHIPHYIEGRYWNVDTAFDVKCITSVMMMKYYYYVAICFDYKYYISQTTLPSMTLLNYLNMKIPLPSLAEQITICTHLDTICTEIDKLIAVKEAKIAKLGEYKKALIYEYVTGKREIKTTP